LPVESPCNFLLVISSKLDVCRTVSQIEAVRDYSVKILEDRLRALKLWKILPLLSGVLSLKTTGVLYTKIYHFIAFKLLNAQNCINEYISVVV